MGTKSANGPSHRRRDRLLREYEHDTYKMRGKPREPTVCPECRAVYHKGRWQWSAVPDGAHPMVCPACQRVHDRCPAGFLALNGPFFADHRNEILHLAHNVEAREKGLHPLRRIIGLEDQDDGVLITTTTMGTARSIGTAVHNAYKGELDYRYTDESNILRVSWRR